MQGEWSEQPYKVHAGPLEMRGKKITGQNQSGIHIIAQARCELYRFDTSGSHVIIRVGLKHSDRSVETQQ